MKEKNKILLEEVGMVFEKSNDGTWIMKRVDDDKNFISTSVSAICTNCPKIVIP